MISARAICRACGPACCLCIALLTGVALHAENKVAYSVEKGWSYRWAKNEPWRGWLPGSKQAPPGRDGRRMLFLKLDPVQAGLRPGDSLYLESVYLLLEVRQAGRLIHAFGDPGRAARGNFAGLPWHIITPFGPEPLIFTIHSAHPRLIGPRGRMRAGRTDQLMRALIRDELHLLVLSGVFLFLGLLALYPAVRRRGKGVPAGFALLSLSLAAETVKYTGTRFLLPVDPLTQHYALWPAGFLFLTGLLFFHERFFVQTGPGWIRPARYAVMVYVIVAWPLVPWTHGAGAAAAYRVLMEVIPMGLIIGGILLLSLAAWKNVRHRREHARAFALGLVLLSMAEIHDLMWNYDLINSGGPMLPWATLGFALLLGFIMENRMDAMSARMRGISHELLQKENALTRERLRSLQRRVHPHFLMNSLNTIHLMMRDDPDRARAALLDLADMYSFLVDGASGDLIAFDEEWDFSLKYLGMQKLRFRELDFHVDRAGSFAGLMLPPLTIQPLLENVFRHGLEGRAGKVRLELIARRVPGGAEILVLDNGAGPGPPGASMNRPEIFNRTLGNVRGRLRHHFKEVELELRERSGGGAGVRIFFRGARGDGESAEVPV